MKHAIERQYPAFKDKVDIDTVAKENWEDAKMRVWTSFPEVVRSMLDAFNHPNQKLFDALPEGNNGVVLVYGHSNFAKTHFRALSECKIANGGVLVGRGTLSWWEDSDRNKKDLHLNIDPKAFVGPDLAEGEDQRGNIEAIEAKLHNPKRVSTDTHDPKYVSICDKYGFRVCAGQEQQYTQWAAKYYRNAANTTTSSEEHQEQRWALHQNTHAAAWAVTDAARVPLNHGSACDTSVKARWMYGDCWSLAYQNPFRWSKWLSLGEIKSQSAQVKPSDVMRPVYLEVLLTVEDAQRELATELETNMEAAILRLEQIQDDHSAPPPDPGEVPERKYKKSPELTALVRRGIPSQRLATGTGSATGSHVTTFRGTKWMVLSGAKAQAQA